MTPVFIILVLILFICCLYMNHRYKLYKISSYKSSINLFIAFNVLLTVYVIYYTISKHNNDIIHANTASYNLVIKDIFKETYEFFIDKPEMQYFFNELFNKIPIPSNIKRDLLMEQLYCYKLSCNTATYANYYYRHINLPDYSEIAVEQNIRVINFYKHLLDSKIFKEYLMKYLATVSGPANNRFYAEFFDIVP